MLFCYMEYVDMSISLSFVTVADRRLLFKRGYVIGATASWAPMLSEILTNSAFHVLDVCHVLILISVDNL
jgi:hypothetical protein